MSATASQFDARACISGGADDYLVKPLVRELIEKKLSALLEKERGYVFKKLALYWGSRYFVQQIKGGGIQDADEAER